MNIDIIVRKAICKNDLSHDESMMVVQECLDKDNSELFEEISLYLTDESKKYYRLECFYSY